MRPVETPQFDEFPLGNNKRKKPASESRSLVTNNTSTLIKLPKFQDEPMSNDRNTITRSRRKWISSERKRLRRTLKTIRTSLQGGHPMN